MNTVGFPKIFQGSSTVVKQGNDATLICMHCLLSTEAGEFFGDPDFGIRLKAYMFDQNNYILKDILMDELYTKICTFCPQLYLQRNNIEIIQKGSTLYATIRCRNRDNYEINTFDLALFKLEEEE